MKPQVSSQLSGTRSSAFRVLTAYPSDAATIPDTTALSYRAGKTRAGNAIIKLSGDGRLGVLNRGSAVHFIIDVTGYFQ